MTAQTEEQVARAPDPTGGAPSRRKWLVLIASVLLSVLLVEVVFRIAGYGADRGPNFQGYVGAGIRLMCYDENLNDYLDVDLTDASVRKRFYEEFGVIDMEKTYHYTPYGVVTPCDHREMRPGQIRPKPPGKIRLIAIGDSFTYGHGLKPGDPWPRQLESLLNADGAGRFEVLNCGVGDTDVAATVQLLVTHLLALAPDAVIYGWYLNDPLQSPSFAEAHRGLMDRTRGGARHIPDRYVSAGWEEVTGPRRWCAIYDWVWTKLEDRELGRLSLEWITGMYGPDNADGWAESQRRLRLAYEACLAKQCKLHVAIWPMLIDLGPGYPLASAHTALSTACEQTGIPVVDLRDHLEATPPDALILHPKDRHPSKRACRIAAEAIREHLRRRHAEWFR